MELRHDELRKDLDAAVQTRKELGSEYESELIDSFLSRMDARLDAQVERRVAERLAEYGPPAPYPGRRGWQERSPRGRFHKFSLVMAIPLSAIGADAQGLGGLLVVWAGIVAVNVAASLSDRREQRSERAERSRRRDGWE
jgi:hypothetical protein